MSTRKDCSLSDTTVLRNLILENPELPVLIFCGEDAWNGEWAYTQATASRGEIEELTLYVDQWMDRDEYEDTLSENLADEEEYKDLSDEDYAKMIQEKINQTEFVKAIVIWVG